MKKHRKHISQSTHQYSFQSQDFQTNTPPFETSIQANRFWSPEKKQLEFFKPISQPLENDKTEEKIDTMIRNLNHLKNELEKTGFSKQLVFQNENEEKERIVSRIDFDSPAERSASIRNSESENCSEVLKEEKREDLHLSIQNQNIEHENDLTTVKLLPSHSRNVSLDDFVKDIQMKLAHNFEYIKEIKVQNLFLSKKLEEQTEEKNKMLLSLANCNDYKGYQSLRQQFMNESNDEMVINRKSSGFHMRRNEEYEEARCRMSMTNIQEFDNEDRNENFGYLKEKIKELEEYQAQMIKGNKKIVEDLQAELEKAAKERDGFKLKEAAYLKEKDDYNSRIKELKTELEKIVMEKEQLLIENKQLSFLKVQVEQQKNPPDQSKPDQKIEIKDKNEPKVNEPAFSKEKEELLFKLNELKNELERISKEKDQLLIENNRLAPYEKETERLKIEKDQSKSEIPAKERDDLKAAVTSFTKEKEDLYLKMSDIKAELGKISLEKDQLLMENKQIRPLMEEVEQLKKEINQPKSRESEKNLQKKKENEFLKEKEQFKSRETELTTQIKAKEAEINRLIKERDKCKQNEAKLLTEVERFAKERDQLIKDKELSEKNCNTLKQEHSKLTEELKKSKSISPKQSSSPPSINNKGISSSNDVKDSNRLSKSFSDDLEAFKIQNEMQKAELVMLREIRTDCEKKCLDYEKKVELLQNELNKSNEMQKGELEMLREKKADCEKKCLDFERKVELLQNELSQSTKNLQENFDRQLAQAENTIQNLLEENRLYKNKVSTDEQDLINMQRDLRELKIRLENEEKQKGETTNSFEKDVINGLSTPKFKKASSQDEIETTPQLKCLKEEKEWLTLQMQNYNDQLKRVNDFTLETAKINQTHIQDLEKLKNNNQELELKVEGLEKKNNDLEEAISEKGLEILRLKRELFEANEDWIRHLKGKTEEMQEKVKEGKEFMETEEKLDESFVVDGGELENNKEENGDGIIQFSMENSPEVVIVEEIEIENNASEENVQVRKTEKEKKALPTGNNIEVSPKEANPQKIELDNKDKVISEKEQMILSLQNEKKAFEEIKGKLEIAVGLKEVALEEKEKEIILVKKAMQSLLIENQKTEQQLEAKLGNIETMVQENELLKKNSFIMEKDLETQKLEINKILLERDDLLRKVNGIKGELLEIQKDLGEKMKIIDKSKIDIADLNNSIKEKNNLIETIKQEQKNSEEKHRQELQLKEKRVEQLIEDMKIKEKSIEQLNINLNESNKQKQVIQSTLTEKIGQFDEIQKKNIEKHNEELNLKEKLISQLTNDKQNLEATLSKAVKDKEDQEKAINEAQKNLNSKNNDDLKLNEKLKTENSSLKQQNEELQKKVGSQNLNRKLSDNKLHEQLQIDNGALMNQLIILQSQTNEKGKVVERLTEKIKTFEKNIADLTNELAVKTKALGESKNTIEQLEKQRKDVIALEKKVLDLEQEKGLMEETLKKVKDSAGKEKENALNQEIIGLRNQLNEKSRIIEQNKCSEEILLETKKQIDMLKTVVNEYKKKQAQSEIRMSEQEEIFMKIKEEGKKREIKEKEREDKLLSYEQQLAKKDEDFQNEKKGLSVKIEELARLNRIKEEKIDKMRINELDLNSKLEEILDKCLSLRKENEKLTESEKNLKLNFNSFKAMLFEENLEKAKLEEQFSQRIKDLTLNEQKGLKTNTDLQKQIETLRNEVAKKENHISILADDLTESSKFKLNALEDQKRALSILFEYLNRDLISNIMKKVVQKTNKNELKLNKIAHLLENLKQKQLDKDISFKRNMSPFTHLSHLQSLHKTNEEVVDWLSLGKSLLLVVSRVLNYQKGTYKSFNDLTSKIRRYGNPRESLKELEKFKSYCDSTFSQISSQYQEISKFNMNSFKKEDFDIVNNLVIDFSENIKMSQEYVQCLNNDIANNYEEIANLKMEPIVSQIFKNKNDDVKVKKEFIEYITKLAMENKGLQKRLNQNYKI